MLKDSAVDTAAACAPHRPAGRSGGAHRLGDGIADHHRPGCRRHHVPDRCSQAQAIEILRAASSARNMKLRDLALNVLTSTSDAAVTTHLD
jgi:hypothetical protein